MRCKMEGYVEYHGFCSVHWKKERESISTFGVSTDVLHKQKVEENKLLMKKEEIHMKSMKATAKPYSYIKMRAKRGIMEDRVLFEDDDTVDIQLMEKLYKPIHQQVEGLFTRLFKEEEQKSFIFNIPNVESVDIFEGYPVNERKEKEVVKRVKMYNTPEEAIEAFKASKAGTAASSSSSSSAAAAAASSSSSSSAALSSAPSAAAADSPMEVDQTGSAQSQPKSSSSTRTHAAAASSLSRMKAAMRAEKFLNSPKAHEKREQRRKTEIEKQFKEMNLYHSDQTASAITPAANDAANDEAYVDDDGEIDDDDLRIFFFPEPPKDNQ